MFLGTVVFTQHFAINTFSSTPRFLTMSNKTFANPTDTANQLNHHFVNISKSLETNLPGSNVNDYFTYLKSPFPSFITYTFIRKLHMNL